MPPPSTVNTTAEGEEEEAGPSRPKPPKMVMSARMSQSVRIKASGPLLGEASPPLRPASAHPRLPSSLGGSGDLRRSLSRGFRRLLLGREAAEGEQGAEPAIVSSPMNVKHCLHVSRDPATGQLNGIPAEWLVETDGQLEPGWLHLIEGYRSMDPRPAVVLAAAGGLEEADPKQNFDQLQEIGMGAQSTVYRAICRKSGNALALKRMKLTEQSLHEVAMMRRIGVHPHLVSLHGAPLCWEGNLWLPVELADGSLSQRLPLSVEECRKVISQVLVGLRHLHGVGIVHGDLKSDNVLCYPGGRVKIADFGHAHANRKDSFPNHPTLSSAYWTAPEVLGSEPVRTEASDVWSLGILGLELCTGHPPHHQEHPLRCLHLIMNSEEPPPIPVEMPVEWRDFLACCLQRRPQDRWTVTQLSQHPFIMTKMLN